MIDTTDLPDDVDVLKAMILASDGREERHIDRIAQLEKLLADFKRALFGAKSEKVDPGQFDLALEDIETAVESIQAAEEADERQLEGKPRPRRANRGSCGACTGQQICGSPATLSAGPDLQPPRH